MTTDMTPLPAGAGSGFPTITAAQPNESAASTDSAAAQFAALVDGLSGGQAEARTKGAGKASASGSAATGVAARAGAATPAAALMTTLLALAATAAPPLAAATDVGLASIGKTAGEVGATPAADGQAAAEPDAAIAPIVTPPAPVDTGLAALVFAAIDIVAAPAGTDTAGALSIEGKGSSENTSGPAVAAGTDLGVSAKTQGGTAAVQGSTDQPADGIFGARPAVNAQRTGATPIAIAGGKDVPPANDALAAASGETAGLPSQPSAAPRADTAQSLGKTAKDQSSAAETGAGSNQQVVPEQAASNLAGGTSDDANHADARSRLGRQARLADDATKNPIGEATSALREALDAAVAGGSPRPDHVTSSAPVHGAEMAYAMAAAAASSTTSSPSLSATALAPALDAARAIPEADVSRQLVHAIRTQFQNGVGEARMTLNPEYLGEVTIALRVVQGAVVATLNAETPAVRAWIEANEPLLRQGLAAQGLTLERLIVSEGRASERQDERQGERRQPPQQKESDPRRRQPREAATFEILM